MDEMGNRSQTVYSVGIRKHFSRILLKDLVLPACQYHFIYQNLSVSIKNYIFCQSSQNPFRHFNSSLDLIISHLGNPLYGFGAMLS